MLAPVKDAARRTSARWPAAILDRGCARRRRDIRPGRRNGLCQPNKETSVGGRSGLAKQEGIVTTHAKQRGGEKMLAKTTAHNGTPGVYKPQDALLAYLKAL